MALSPMMRQYLQIHDRYPDCLLLFRLGDFYELFFDDAKTASRELELTLTGKDCGLEERAPMCGVPFHSVNTYIDKLISRGYKVAICEQMEDPATAKGLVDRDVVRVITAGTITDSSLLEEKRNNYLLCLFFSGNGIGMAYADASTGELFVLETDESGLMSETERISPREIICNLAERINPNGMNGICVSEQPASWFQPANAKETLTSQFKVQNLMSLGLEDHPLAASAAGALMKYLLDTQKNGMEHFVSIRFADSHSTMCLDQNTRRNLELTEGIRTGRRRGTLLSVLDQTCTAMGGRQLKSWVESPLLSLERINIRLDAVEELKDDRIRTVSLRDALQQVYDIERLVSKVSYKSINARDCLSLCASLKKIPEIKSLLSDCRSDLLKSLRDQLYELRDLSQLLENAIHPDAPAVLSEGGIIRDGYSKELDSYREAQKHGKQWIVDIERREREETGIRNLRIQYNRVFGYYIEITRSNLNLVPERYIRKQTLTNAERFMTPELKEIEQKIVGAQEQAVRLEMQLFEEVRGNILTRIREIQSTSNAVKQLDALQSLGCSAAENRYVRPEVNENGSLRIVQGRHPVVEQNLPDGGFVPNDTVMDNDENRMMIITGPNMAGKSTYMRQVALIVLMAQIGSFVPAEQADIAICDRIFTRVGASDDLASGQSTFMVEMSETANILRNATSRSLVILDEIGRGTSTFDGLAIAWAVVEYICDRNKVGAKTLFATHYHELSELEGHLEGVKNYCISVKEHGEDVIFLRTIQRGGADKSFGIHVAKLAGIPHEVIVRAHEIQARLEVSDINQNQIGKNILGENEVIRENQQMDLFAYKTNEIINELQNTDVMALTPMDAINKLFLLREKARNL